MKTTYTELLICELTPGELAERAHQFAITHQELREKEDEKARISERLNATIKLLKQSIDQLSETVATGKEERAVDVEDRPDWDRKLMLTIRLDTYEKLRERDLTPAERQERLFENETGLPRVTASDGPEVDSVAAVEEFFGQPETEATADGIDEDPGGTPIKTELSQVELDRVAEFCCPLAIAEGGKIRICHIAGNPYVIVGSVSSNKRGTIEVSAYAALPLSIVGEEGVRTYAEASKDLDGQRDNARDEGEEYPRLSYVNMKVNCGSAKKPDWWVMVGEEVTFTAIPGAEVKATVKTADKSMEIPEGFTPDPRILCWCSHKYADHMNGAYCKKRNCGCNDFSYQAGPKRTPSKGKKHGDAGTVSGAAGD